MEDVSFSALRAMYLALRGVSPDSPRSDDLVLRLGVSGAWGTGALIDANKAARCFSRSAANDAARLSRAEGGGRGGFTMVTIAADNGSSVLWMRGSLTTLLIPTNVERKKLSNN